MAPDSPGFLKGRGQSVGETAFISDSHIDFDLELENILDINEHLSDVDRERKIYAIIWLSLLDVDGLD
ncbi:MAG: hypothetical protein JW839_08900 [Candidatus Lokiarchaeota archaeon]|nr:hypothetical protein [Candidatus Lokiarchaeota archaeon]